LDCVKIKTLTPSSNRTFSDTREDIDPNLDLEWGTFNYINEEQAKAFNLVQDILGLKSEM
jgi:hypothetical protein